VLGAVSVTAEPDGVTEADTTDAGESPTALVATTLNVTAVELANPVIAHVVAPIVVQVRPLDAVTRYPVMADPPFDEGAVHDTSAAPFRAEPVTAVGAPGTLGWGVRVEGR